MKRTTAQNRYLHKLLDIFREELNKKSDKQYSKEEFKLLCRVKFLTVDVMDDEGYVISQKVLHTSELNTLEEKEFIENLIMWAADTFHIILSFPDEI